MENIFNIDIANSELGPRGYDLICDRVGDMGLGGGVLVATWKTY